MNEQNVQNDEDDWYKRRTEREHRRYLREQEKWSHLQKVLPLPRRATPLPWEDLASVLSRTSRRMGYERPQWLLHQENIPHTVNQTTIAVLHRRADYLFLEHQLLLEEEQLYALTLHRFTSQLYIPSTHWTASDNHATIKRRCLWYEDQQYLFLSERFTQICPLCLSEGNEDERYDRLYWRCRFLLVCPRHRVFLLNRCPTCQHPIPALRPKLLTCPACGNGDYSHTVYSLHKEDAWLLDSQRLLLSQLGVAADERGAPHANEEQAFLRSLTSPDFFSLLRGFLRLFDMSRGRVPSLLLRSLPLQSLLQQLAQQRQVHIEMVAPIVLSLYLLIAWPAHILAFLSLLPRVLQEEYHYTAESLLLHNWSVEMVRGNYWCPAAYRSGTVSLMQRFFDTYEHYFSDLLKAEVEDERQGGKIVNEQIVFRGDLQAVTPAHIVTPRPWESLASVMTRVARKMGYRRPEWVLHTLREELPAPFLPTDITLVVPGEGARWLGHRLHLDEETVYQLTLHRFAALLQAPTGVEVPSSQGGRLLLTQTTIGRYCTPNGTTQLCPACLDEQEWYEPLYWRLRHVLLCTRHRVFLSDRCPICHKLIPLLRHTKRTLCPYCLKGDYRSAPRLALPASTLLTQGQTLLLSVLGINDIDRKEHSPLWKGSPLIQLEPWQYFYILDRFGILAPSLVSADMLSAFANHTVLQQELLSVYQSGKSQLARQMILHTAAFSTGTQPLHALLHKTSSQTVMKEVSIQNEIPLVESRSQQSSTQITVEPYNIFSTLQQELEALITAMRMLSHQHREEAFSLP